jgi:hypothetical protein
MRVRTLVVIVIGVVSQMTATPASIIYSNYGAPFPSGVPGGYADSTNSLFDATTFTTTGSGNLESIAFGINDPSQATLTAGLYTNVSGQPDALLESWTFVGPINFGSTITTLTSASHPFLFSGTQYFFVWTQNGSRITWYQNNQGVTGGVWIGNSLTALSQSFSISPTPGIQLTSVPEPPAGLPLLMGVMVLLLLRLPVRGAWQIWKAVSGPNGVAMAWSFLVARDTRCPQPSNDRHEPAGRAEEKWTA